jgi:hypothetical protein
MVKIAESVEEDRLDHVQEFAVSLSLLAERLAGEMQLTHEEVNTAFVYLLAECLSHRSKSFREKFIQALPALIESGADDFEAQRKRNLDA